MVSLNKINVYKIEKGARNFVSEMGKSGYAPVILLEAAVVAGRTYQAKKRGGYVEARERLTEESLGSVFWLGGVAAFNRLGDMVGKKLLGLKDVNFDVGKDNIRKPFQNYMAKLKADKAKFVDFKKLGENLDELKDIVGNPANFKKLEQKLATCKADKTKFVDFAKLEKHLAVFKFVKIISSILLANTVMGLIVPKLNQAITTHQQKNKANKGNTPNQATTVKTSIDDFINKTNKDDKNVSFKGFRDFGIKGLLNTTNRFEHDTTWKLLSTDVGTAAGRAANARNKNERLEILVRDIGSVYFYLYASNHLNSGLNYLQDGRASRLDTTSAKQLDSHIRTNFANEKYSAEEFEKLVLGNKEAQIPNELKTKFQDGKAIISLEEFETVVGKDSAEAKIAKQMSRLQPEHPTGAIITESQVKAIYTEGLINDPKFLNKVFKQSTNKASTNPTKFVAESDLIKLKGDMINYVEDIVKKAKKGGEDVTLDILSKANKNNFRKNALNLGAGFAVSAIFLSTVIPKVQYWITKQKTGEDKFPGVQ